MLVPYAPALPVLQPPRSWPVALCAPLQEKADVIEIPRALFERLSNMVAMQPEMDQVEVRRWQAHDR
jgi:hypothetical protein